MLRTTVLVLTVLAAIAPSLHAGESKKPNVLFIMSDDLNTDLGCYGNGLVRSPNIDRLAKRGVRFDRAYCQYPLCNPSRSSIMTGLYPGQTGVRDNSVHFRENIPDVVTLAQLFQRFGYFVARIGKIYHYGVPLQIGTAGLDDPPSWQKAINPRGIDREVHDQIHTLEKDQFGGTLSWLKLDSKDEEHTDGKSATEAIQLLEESHPQKTGKPFFIAVGFYRPHTPYVAPSKYFDLYPADKIQPIMEKAGDRDDIPAAALADRPGQRELTVEQRKEIIQAYYASTSFMDAQVGRVLAALERLGLADNTIVIFLSDHGYQLGAHGLWQKIDLFEGSTHVPLIIADPRNSKNGTGTKAIVESLDLYPTLAELCGLKAPEHLKGQSLVPILRDPNHKGKEAALTQAFSAAGRMHKEVANKKILGYSIRTDRYRYTEWADGKFGNELYDYTADPEEFTNLARDPQSAELVRRMQQLLAETRRRAEGKAP